MTQKSESITRVPASFTFILDKSGSMGQNDSSGQRKINSLKNAVKYMIDQSDLDEYRFTTYDTHCGSTSPAYDLTQSQDKTDADSWINGISQGGWTNIACGLKQAYSLQSSAVHDAKAVILLTDGVANRGTYSTECCSNPHGGAVCWADKTKTDLKVPVFTIDFGQSSNFDAPDALLPPTMGRKPIRVETILRLPTKRL
jgi:Mg-chelatase subunit ChlD